MYGIDVISKRLSRLDKEIVKFALDWKGPKVAVEFGAGSGRLSLILTLIGYRVYIYDVEESEILSNIPADLKPNYKMVDIRNVKISDLPEGISVFIAERVLHFLSFVEAKRVLFRVIKRMERYGRLFVSLSGIRSPIGEDYAHAGLPVENRFCEPSENVKKKFKIDVPICLYDLEDVKKLFSGFPVKELDLRETPFGNFEGIFEKT